MKKIVAVVFVVMVMVYSSTAMANFVQSMDPVSIWAVDCYDAGNGGAGQDGEVILAASSVGGGTLQYSLDEVNWYNFSNGTAEISDMSSCKEEVFLQFEDASGTFYNDGTLTFIGDPGSCCSLPVYSAVLINWDTNLSTDLSFLSTSALGGCDKLAPVPIPPSAAMLFFGLLGLFGVRRMRQDS